MNKRKNINNFESLVNGESNNQSFHNNSQLIFGNAFYDGDQICYNLKPCTFFDLKHCLGLRYFEKSFDSCCNCMMCRIVSFIENTFVKILISRHVIILKIF